MRTFAQKPKAQQQATPAKSMVPSRAHFRQSHEVNSILHLQSTILIKVTLRLLQANTEGLKSRIDSVQHHRAFSHDFSRIPLYPPAVGAIQTKLDDQHTSGTNMNRNQIVSQIRWTEMPEPQLQRACGYGGNCPKCSTEQDSQKQLQTKHKQAQDK